MADIPGRGAGRENAGRGQGRGRAPRGRPRGDGGGRRGGRGGAQVPRVAHESDDEAEIQVEDLRANGLNANPFPGAIEDDEENEDDEAPAVPQQALPGELFEYLPPEALGDEQYCINGRDFIPGPDDEATSIDRFYNYSPIQLVLYFAQDFFDLLLECTNEVPSAQITMKDLYCYHAVLTLMTTVRMDKVEYFWNPPSIMGFNKEAAELRSIFSLNRYYHVRKHLRAYKQEDDNDGKGVGWKVRRAAEVTHEVFKTTMSCPGENISLDEGMAAASSTRNPIYVSIPMKPLEGFRFFMAVAYESKICVGFLPDLKQFPRETYEHHPGGFPGKVVCTLLESMNLTGSWYRFWLDNYYNSLALTDHVLENYSMCIGGTMQKGRKTNLINFGNAKKPKPSNLYPKGSLKIAKCTGKDIYEYAWMDSCGVYFIDCSHGPGNSEQIFRRNRQGQPIPFLVPVMMVKYNDEMGAVDVVDKIRMKNANDVQHATKKYTVRYFEVIWSFDISQGYNVYRHVNRARRDRYLNPTEFKMSTFKGFLNHPVVKSDREPEVNDEPHILMQSEPGSKDEDSVIRKTGKCRQCPNTYEEGGIRYDVSRKTTYYCSKCKIFLHPQCFTSWHDENGTRFVPSRQHII